ncbi:hypothetical protein STVIR_8104 [Streptomyces viridochromogenes Tue57]|uniref:Uncharacterized protein n=1 Tax=Streptomyces viridochromogenes Tue57 TaxID=1160705 RepID=L8P385_STRVR|nr:hypothetical protein STVIR_8104 [Streptomyces viridochromogenes Tue57]
MPAHSPPPATRTRGVAWWRRPAVMRLDPGLSRGAEARRAGSTAARCRRAVARRTGSATTFLLPLLR